MKSRLIKYLSSHTPEIQGILWMITACFWFSVMATMIRHISTEMNTLEMVFFRNLFCVICMIPWMIKFGFKNIKTKRWDLYGYRATSGVIGMFMFFYGLSVVPLPEAISLTFSVPIITAVFAVFFLKEKVGAHRWMAMIIGFVGVIIILRPGSAAFQPAAIFILLTTVSWSASNIFVKKLTETDNSKVIVFISMLLTTPLALIPALFVWQTPTMEQLAWLFALALITNQAQIALTNSYGKTDISVVLPFDFSRLIFITILAYIFFGEVISSWTILGAVVIFVSSLYIARRTSKKADYINP